MSLREILPPIEHGLCAEYSDRAVAWEALNDVLNMSGGAAYILDASRFVNNVTRLRAAFEEYYPNFHIGYSYKTNYLPRLCLLAESLQLRAEVVSGAEYDLARKLGISGSSIIFNGPSKDTAQLLRAFGDGALVNIDSLSEAERVVEVLTSFKGVARIGLRCNLDLKWNERESRFGLSESSGELDAAYNLLKGQASVEIEGLHCHTSFDRSASSFGTRIKRLIELADRLFGDVPPAFIDVGGGLAGPMPESLSNQFCDAPSQFEDYAQEICEPMHSHYGKNGPELIVEPGIGLVGDVFEYIYRVDHIKQVGMRRFAMTSGAAHHIKIVPNNINPPTHIYRAPGNKPDDRCLATDVVGFTCLEHDLLFRGLEGNPLSGDILAASNVGGYSMVSSPDFIRPNPMVVELVEGGWKVLRKKTSIDDIVQGFFW